VQVRRALLSVSDQAQTELALAAFRHTADYDRAISDYLTKDPSG